MSPWPPEGEKGGKGAKAVTPRPGHADLAGVLKYGHDDVRNALERASARHTAVHVAAGAVAALLAELGITVEGRPVEVGGETTDEGMREATDAARKDRDTLGGIVEVVATGVPPGLGVLRGEGGSSRRAARVRVDGDPGRQGRRDRRRLRARPKRRDSEAHDEIDPGLHRRTNRAGGIEAGISNGEPIVVRGMKPLPTLMRPLDSVDLERRAGDARRALRRAGRRSARGRRGGSSCLRARPAALEKFGGTRSSTSAPPTRRTSPASATDGSRGSRPALRDRDRRLCRRAQRLGGAIGRARPSAGAGSN